MADIEWEYEKCPICGQPFPYVKGGYKPKTCSKFDCVHQYHHPELSKSRKGGKS